MAAGESGGLPAPAWQQLQRPGSLDGHELHFLHASMSHPDMCVARAAACETAERARMVLDVFSEEDAVENSKVIVLPVRSRSASSALQGSAEVIDLFSGQSI
ncbi:hypothetical protein [Geoalkalibacter halelectricus]|uniref:hypothetical protein n=1 Tax=Geoalkalibacter halelectricus TaxID=2847045 RepID=UPI003D20B28B